MEVFFLIAGTVTAVSLVGYFLDKGFKDLFGLSKKPAPKPIADTDLYGIKARELALQAKKSTFWQQRQEWRDEFNRLLQSTCKHEFDMHAQQWYVCTKCKYEQPWYYKDDCSCVTQTWRSYNGMYDEQILRHRSGTCNVHGRDFEQYKQEALKWHIQQRKYSKGGIIN